MTQEQKIIRMLLQILGDKRTTFLDKVDEINGALRMAARLAPMDYPDDKVREIFLTACHLGYSKHGSLRGEL